MKNRIGLLALLLPVLVIAKFAVAGERKTCHVSFHTINGMVLLDAQVNGRKDAPLFRGERSALAMAY